MGLHPKTRARHRPRRRRRAKPRRRHAARHRHILRRAPDPTRQVLLGAALGERDDAVAPDGRPPLQRRIDGGAPRAKVPVEHVAVWLVDDGGHAREPRREAPDEAGFGGVGVNDVGPLGADEADQLPERHDVGDERHLAPERRHVEEPAPAPAGVLEHRVVGLAERDGQRAKVARALERDDGRDGVLRRAPDGEASDHVQDADAHASRRGPPPTTRVSAPSNPSMAASQ